MTDLVLDHPPTRKPDLDLRRKFVAVIFANGEDDDLPGLEAAFKDEPVQFDEKVYAPGEDITIESRKIFLNTERWLLLNEGDDIPEGWEDATATRSALARAARHITIRFCHFIVERRD